MSLNSAASNPSSFLSRLNGADPNTLPALLQALGIGTIMRQRVTALRRISPNAAAVSPYDIATVQAIQLPDDAKCRSISRAYARAGTGTLGELTVTPYASPFIAPAATHIGITPAGNLAFLIADAYTDVDVEYEVEVQDVVELTLQAAPSTGVCALPAALVGTAGSGVSVGVTMLMEAEILVGTVTGKKIVLVPATSAPATGLANLDAPKANVRFAVADGAQSVRVKLGICSVTDVNATLEGTSTIL